MKVGDKVRLVNPDEQTRDYGAERGDIGTVIQEVNGRIFYVDFTNSANYFWVNAEEIQKVETYGEVTYGGCVYYLIDDATETNRLTETPYIDVLEGEIYEFEMSAPAIDSDGTEYTIYWTFFDRKCQEIPSCDLDYSCPAYVLSKY